MGMRGLLRRCLDVPVALLALAALAVVWWTRARRSEGVGPRADAR